MNIISKIKLQNNIFICLNLKNNNLCYELEYNEDNYNDEPYDIFYVYKKKDTGTIRYKNIFYEKIKHSDFTKNKQLKEGLYLFIFNRTKIFIEFSDNKISYEMEDIGIEELIDLS